MHIYRHSGQCPSSIAILSLAVLSATATPVEANAQSANNMGGISRSDAITVRATVVSVDQSTRHVALRRDDGRQLTVRVPDNVSALNTVKVGDRVSMTFYQSLTFVQNQPGAPAPAPRTASAAVRMRDGEARGGAVAGKDVFNALVVGVDPSANTLSVVDPAGGQVETFHVVDLQMRQALPNVKVGAIITIIATDAIALSLTPA